MNSDIGVLIEELKLIRDNIHGDLKKNSNIYLTHSEVISFARAFVRAVDTDIIDPFSRYPNQLRDRIILHMNLIRTPGIPHCDRSRAAAKCVEILEASVPLESGYPEGVSSYPGETNQQQSIDVEMQEVTNNKYPKEHTSDWDSIAF